MDVRLPDGTVITNVPEGTTQSDLIRRVGTAQQMFDPASGMSMYDKFMAGAGKAIVDTGRGIGSLVGLTSQQDIDEAKRLDAPLMDTGAGLAGNVVGNLATMVGPGAAVGAIGKVANLPRLVSAAGSFVAPQTIKGGAALGAGMSAIQPVATDESRGLNTALGGVVGGLGTAGANALGRLLSPRAASITPDQGELVRQAEALGYKLKPSEQTGKRWQQNIEAAMGQMPSTSGRMQAIGAQNQAVTNAQVERALGQVGGTIDQPSAAAGAMEGWQQGMGAEQGRLGSAYRDLLSGAEVPLEAARPGLEALRAKQAMLPETSQSGAGMDALRDLLGAPSYGANAKALRTPQVNPNTDDIVTAIRKLGGISTSDESIGSLAKHYAFSPDPRGPVWRTNGGSSVDRMAEALHERGYITDRNSLGEVMSKIEDAALSGKQSFSMFHTPENPDPLANAIEKLTAKLDTKSAPPAPKAGYIRDNPVVPGDVAQSLRSDYTQASSKESTGRDRMLFSAMKDAVDGAIEAALPEAKRGTFKAINSRYGIYAGLDQISPKQQNVFLNQLYRGSESPDLFYSFLGMAPEGKFKDVARGFVSKVVAGATDEATGNVSAQKLGAALSKTNPEALKYLGGPSSELLSSVGNIGRDLLREQTPNSGTGQRLMYQGLLTGSGLGLGGYLGSGQGNPGAVAGSALGAFAVPKALQAAYMSNALRPLLTAGTHGRAGALTEEEAKRLAALLSRMPTAGLLGLSQQ